MRPTADGTYFIDRDPHVFRHILNYLRGEKPNIAALSRADRKELKKEAEFYQIQSLIELIHDGKNGLEWEDGPNYVVLDSGRKIKKVGESKWNAIAISSNFSKKWAIDVVSRDGNVIIGLAPSTIDQSQVISYNFSEGWFLYLSQQYLFPSKTAYAQFPKCASAKVIVELNEQREIVYTINEKQCGVAYKNIPDVLLVACVFIYNVNDTVKFADL